MHSHICASDCRCIWCMGAVLLLRVLVAYIAITNVTGGVTLLQMVVWYVCVSVYWTMIRQQLYMAASSCCPLSCYIRNSVYALQKKNKRLKKQTRSLPTRTRSFRNEMKIEKIKAQKTEFQTVGENFVCIPTNFWTTTRLKQINSSFHFV